MKLSMKIFECHPPFFAIFLALFTSTLLFSSLHSLRDSISANQILRDGETLVSESGIYVLGFFNGNTTNKTKYLGLWYNFSTDIIVWVANRENPVTKSFAALQLNENGHLKILQGQSSNMVNTTGDVEVVWSSNSSTLVSSTKAKNQTVAKLSNSGNLRVTDGGLIWQSFDYPTDTILPGMKLGFDKISNKEWFLTSWKAPGDPSRSNFIYKFDTSGSKQFYFIVNNQKIYRFGPWNGAWFNGLNGMITEQRMYRYVDNETTTFYEYVNVEEGMYIRFTIFPNITTSRMIWKIQEPNWVPDSGTEEVNNVCDLYSRCGPNGICKFQDPFHMLV